jgi:hypothetical protein
MNKRTYMMFKKKKPIKINFYSCITVKFCKAFEDVVLRHVKEKLKLYTFSFQIHKFDSKKTIT